MATTTHSATDTLNSLLRGELSAVETYRQAEEKFKGESEVMTLQRFRTAHQEAVNILQQHVIAKGGTPSESSGAWGTFATLVEGTAKIFGKTAALKALKEGEEQGISDYQSALKDSGLPSDCRSLIQTNLLPKCQQHIQTLDHLMSQQ